MTKEITLGIKPHFYRRKRILRAQDTFVVGGGITLRTTYRPAKKC